MARKLIEQVECDGCGRQLETIEQVRITIGDDTRVVDLCRKCRQSKTIVEAWDLGSKEEIEEPAPIRRKTQEKHRVEEFIWPPEEEKKSS